MKEGVYIEICVIDSDPIHRQAFTFLSEKTGLAHMRYCRHHLFSTCGYQSDMALVSMDMRDVCSSYLLHQVLVELPDIPVICYSAENKVNRFIQNQFKDRLIHVSCDELFDLLNEYFRSVAVSPSNRTEFRKMSGGFYENMMADFHDLSSREIEVLSLLSRGHGVLEITNILEITRSTVESHIKSIRNKHKLSSTQAVKAYALSCSESASCIAFTQSEDCVCPFTKSSLGECDFLRSA